MKRAPLVLLALALSAPLAACSDDAPDSVPTSATAPATAEASPQEAPSPEPTEAAAATAAPQASTFPADTSADRAQPTGGPLTVTAVRVARQAGYDRIVFELAGKTAGQPGWNVEYVDSPTQQGSGDPVDVDGEAVLSVTITGTGYPFDTGVDEVEGDPAVPGDVQLVEDVVLGAVFEGQYEAFVGLSQKAPFRVFRLADPARVVVDVRR